MKHYFNYGANISSKEASEAIAMVHGCGPIIGFGSATINVTNNTLRIYPLPSQEDPMYREMLGRQKKWNITRLTDDPENSQVKFAGISKDGYIFSAGDDYFDVSIQGNKGVNNEVLVFAVHTPISEPVDNPITFMAFWSESTDPFYTLYHKSLDPYYPLPVADRKYNFANNSGIDTNLNYDILESKVTQACTYYFNNKESMVFIGVYGTGNNPVTGLQNEYFALVPYDGEFPDNLPYTPAIHRSLRLSIKRLEGIIGDNTSGNESGITTIADLMAALKKDIIEEVRKDITLATMPVGSIILWEGSEIPQGWAEYTKARGRVVVGYNSGGISVPESRDSPNNDIILSSLGSIYNPVDGDYAAKLTTKDIPKHRHGIGMSEGNKHNLNTESLCIPQNWDYRDSTLSGAKGVNPQVQAIEHGSIYTSPNFTSPTDSTQAEVASDQFNVIKLPKAVTLMYIIKVAN